MGFDQIREQVADARRRAVEAAQAAHEDRRRKREENDLWVSGGVNWDGFGLKSLIKMVADRSSPAQLNALAGEWSRHGGAVSTASQDLQKALDKLLNYWTGQASDEAVRKVTTNAKWIGELGDTAQQMSGPIQDASGALRSAQDTMPGMPKNNWLATAGGGAAAGFAVGGPIGAAFGAAIGGIVSVFGFGSKKKKMKRKAVQTMERYEGALLGIDQTTPQFGLPSDGTNPGTGPGGRPDPGVNQPPVVAPPPGGGVFKPSPPIPGGNHVTNPSFAGGPEHRWQQLTGLGPGGVNGWQTPGGGGGLGPNGLGPNALGGMPGMLGRGGAGGMGGAYGRGGGAAGRGGGAGRGGMGRGGGGFPGGMGMGGRGGDREYRGRGRFSGTGPFGGGGGGRRDQEEDGEHRRRVPIEEDPFTTDLKAAPPVIGL